MALKRSPLKRIGKIGKANIEARKSIADQCEEIGLNTCELRFEGCLVNWALAPAHRHKRIWYKGDAKLLADKKQWIAACTPCHFKIEHDEERTKQAFQELRGPE